MKPLLEVEINAMSNDELVMLLQDYSMRSMYSGNSASRQNEYHTLIYQMKKEILKRMK